MSIPPAQPKIYHITHVENLAAIIADGELRSDAEMLARGGPKAAIGMSKIKERRLRLPIECLPGCCVGDFVPFYFCPRSIMLFVLHRANHAELTYRGGQGPIVHLEADLHTVVAWAESNERRWTFSLSNAGAYYTASNFRTDLARLDEIDWAAVAAADFRDARVKEAKQAEFLVHRSFPWSLVDRIGVHSQNTLQQCTSVLASVAHKPRLERRPDWYF